MLRLFSLITKILSIPTPHTYLGQIFSEPGMSSPFSFTQIFILKKFHRYMLILKISTSSPPTLIIKLKKKTKAEAYKQNFRHL